MTNQQAQPELDNLIAENTELRQKIAELEAKLEKPLLAKETARHPAPTSIGHIRETLNNINLFAISVEENGIITYCNKFVSKLTGWRQEELVGKNYFEVLVPLDDRQARWDHFRQAIIRQGFWDETSRAILTRHGDVKYISFNSLILNYEDDHISGVTKIGEDVTEQNKVTLALRRSNEALQDLFDNSNDLIFICTLQGDFLFANKAFKRKLGYDNEELAALNVKDILYEKVKKRTYRTVLEIVRGFSIPKFETILINKKGKPLHLEGNVNCRFENGQATAIRGIVYDITDRIRAEKAQTLYYSIGNLTVKSKNLDQLYQSIHQELGKVIEVNNFYIKLYNANKTEILFPYYVDEAKGSEQVMTRRKAGKGLTDFVMKREKALFLHEEEIVELMEQNEVEVLFGPLPKVWIGVPLKFENEVIGLISVKCYRSRNTYDISDLELLDFISGQIALAIQRKKNEEMLSNQSARLQAIFESSSHMIWSLNRKNEVTSCNQNYKNAFLEQYGIELDQKNALSMLHYEMAEAQNYGFWQEKMAEAFGGEKQYIELKERMKDGRYRWREVYLNPIRLRDGSIEEISAISHDITGKKLSEIALKNSELKFRNIFQSFQDIYLQADLAGRITLLSPSVQEITGYLPEEIIGRNIEDFIPQDQSLSHLIRDLIRKKSIKNFETPLRKKNGEYIQSISNIRLATDENQRPMGIVGVVRDITELKNATEEVLLAKELAERSLRVKESFLANMSHEIRTPMNGVIGMLDLMMATRLNEEQHEYMYTIRKSSETLMYILNDILDLSKIEAGKMELQFRSTNLRSTIEKVYTLFLQQANTRGNTLEYNIDAQIPPFLLADETRLLQIVSNLTSNAIKFTEDGRVSLYISLLDRIEDLCTLKFEVRDTGIGIDQEKVKLLFNSFSQLDNSSSKSYAGTGLGLSISKELSHLMGGEIGVNSSPGEGSNFWFTIQAKATNKQPYQEESAPYEFVAGNQFGQREPQILVVDDNVVNRSVASKILEKAGCHVFLAQSGSESIHFLQRKAKEEQKLDLIFMDIQMPDMDGVQATSRIRALNLPHLPPIVAMTAYSMKEDRDKFISKGLDDYIPKPIKAQSLINKVKEYILPSPDQQGAKSDTPQSIPKLETPASPLPLSLTQPVVDPEVVAQLAKYGGKELVMDSLVEFEQDTEEILQNCTKALQASSYEEALKYLHTLKGNASTLGVNAVAQKAAYLEKMIKNNTLEPVLSEWDSLNQAFQDFKDRYQEELV